RLSTGTVIPGSGGGQIAGGSDVTVNSAGLLDLNDNSNAVASLTLTGGGDVSTGSGTLTLGGNVAVSGGSSEISGRLALGAASRTLTVGSSNSLTVSAAVSGADGVSLIKDGPGNMLLGNANSYLGTTIVNAGTLTVTNANAL